MYKELGIDDNVVKLINECEEELKEEFKTIEKMEETNSLKVLDAFHKNEITESCFNETTGYGYNDLGRDKIEKIFSEVLGSEDALVRSQFISGSHALNVCFFALLRPNDLLLSVTGKPYDTLDEVIGIKDNPSSLKSYGIKYDQIDLVNDDFDYEKIENTLQNNSKIKVIEIQRSKGYSTRKSLTIDKVEKVIKFIRNINKDVIIMIDNCYCEFVEEKEPLEIGADIIVGSLIKNLGAGIAPTGGYIAGKKELVQLAAERLTAPGEGKEIGPSLGMSKAFLQGLYMAPSVVASSLKTAVFASKLLEELGYNVEPKFNDERADIVQNIIFNDSEKLIKYCQGIQKGSPIDSEVVPTPWNIAGYQDPIIMAGGTFTQGSTIELSCDGPVRPPYIAYMQGGLTYEYGKLGVLKAVQNIL